MYNKDNIIDHRVGERERKEKKKKKRKRKKDDKVKRNGTTTTRCFHMISILSPSLSYSCMPNTCVTA